MILILALLLAAAEAPSAVEGASLRAGEALDRIESSLAQVPALFGSNQDGRYVSEERAVSNWRREAVRALQAAPLSAAAALRGEGPLVTRCVKLNNHWCIKSAGWAGEVGADEEGHAGFSTAERGADAAVNLLRRYYVEYGRKSALDIVRRWAPAECRMPAIGGGKPLVVAVRGIGNTLRARWLAAHRGRRSLARASGRLSRTVSVKAEPGQGRASVVSLRPLPTYRVPDIAAGLGERWPKPEALGQGAAHRAERWPKPEVLGGGAAPSGLGVSVTRAPVRIAVSASTPPVGLPGSTFAPTKAAPEPVCAPDEQRIRNYAARIAASVGSKPDSDLDLFDPDGRPRPNLAPVLLAMSGFELGMLQAREDIVAAAISRAADRLVAEAAKTSPPP